MARPTRRAGAVVLCVLAGALTASRVLAQEADPLVHTDADGAMTWYDARGLNVEGKGWTDTETFYDRLPARAKEIVRPPVWSLSQDSAGLAVHFRTDADRVTVRWSVRSESLDMPHMPATGVSGVDLYRWRDEGGWAFVGNGRPHAVSNEAGFDTAGGGRFLLYLPLYNGTAKLEIGVPSDRTVESAQRTGADTRPVVFYGTSITQGGCASRPGMAAVAVAGRLLDVPTINLGFSGNGQMEPEVVELLCELDPRLYVLDALWNMGPGMVSDLLEPSVRALRAAHPETPIVVVEDCRVWNTVPTEMGTIAREIVERLTAEGVPGLTFVSAEGMLGADGEGTVDGVHPNDLGMARQGAALAEALRPLLGP